MMFCFKNTSFLLLFFTQILILETKAGYINDVKEFLDEFTKLGEPSFEMSAQLSKASQKIGKIISLAGPVGSFCAYAMSLAFEDKSENIEALKELNTTLMMRFDQLETRIEHLQNEMAAFQLREDLRDYDNSITHFVEGLEYALLEVLDPLNKASRIAHRKRFVDHCNNIQYSPLSLLRWINRRVNENCRNATWQETTLYANGLRLFDQISMNASEFFSFPQKEFEGVKREILYGLSLLEYDDGMQRLEKIREAYANNSLGTYWLLERRILLLRNNLSTPNTDLCLLKTAIEGNDWLRAPLEKISDMVQIDVLKLTAMGAICANVSSDGDPHQTNKTLENISRISNLILSTMGAYVHNKLLSTWPNISKIYVEKAVGERYIYEDKYNETALRIKQELDVRCPYNVFHISMIWPSSLSTEYKLFLNGSADYTFSIKDKSGIGLFVARYEHGQHVRAQAGTNWFTKHRKNINFYINKLNNYGINRDAESLYNTLVKMIPKFNDAFPNTLILLEWAYWTTNREIDYGIAVPNVFSNPTVRYVHNETNFLARPGINTYLFKLL